jgi:hypothetical protein
MRVLRDWESVSRCEHPALKVPQQAAYVVPGSGTFVAAPLRHLAHVRRGGNVIN